MRLNRLVVSHSNVLKATPPIDLVNSFLNLFNLKDINDTKLINRKVMNQSYFKNKIKLMIPDILQYISNYKINCMNLKNDFTDDNIFTILKYFLVYHQRYLYKYETTVEGRKTIYYKIHKKNSSDPNFKSICIKRNQTVYFD